MDKPARYGFEPTFRLEVLFQLDGIHVKRLVIDVHKIDLRPGLRNRLGRRNESVWNRNDCLAGSDASSHQSKPQRIGPASHTDRETCAAKLCKGLLKLFHNWTTDKGGRPKSGPENLNQFVFHLRMGGS